MKPLQSNDPTRLTMADVQTIVEVLPDDVIEELAEGPVVVDPPEDIEPCRLCRVLDPLLESSDPPEAIGADLLTTWHESLELFTPWSEIKLSKKADRAVQELTGALAYARCVCVYEAAQLELCKRRAAGRKMVDRLEASLAATREPRTRW